MGGFGGVRRFPGGSSTGSGLSGSSRGGSFFGGGGLRRGRSRGGGGGSFTGGRSGSPGGSSSGDGGPARGGAIPGEEKEDGTDAFFPGRISGQWHDMASSFPLVGIVIFRETGARSIPGARFRSNEGNGRPAGAVPIGHG
jgi:hypothetical protein